jgi:hypothetical protein
MLQANTPLMVTGTTFVSEQATAPCAGYYQKLIKLDIDTERSRRTSDGFVTMVLAPLPNNVVTF